MEIKRLNNDPVKVQAINDDVMTSNTDNFYMHAIAASGAIPYHFRFGEREGEGTYIGSGGLSDLIGVRMNEIPENLFELFVEKTIPPADGVTRDLQECWRRIKEGEADSCRIELLVRTKSGRKKWFNNTSLPVIDNATGVVTGVFGILSDITTTRMIDDKIKEKEEEFDNLKRSLINNIAHEIRTPLNAIVGFAALLNEYSDNPERRQECIEIITCNTDHLVATIDNIMEISRIDSKLLRIKKDTVNLHEVLRKIHDEFNQEASSKGLELSIAPDSDEEKPEIITDRFKLLEILRNLVANAIKFTFEGKVEFGYTIDKANIKFYVSDTGIGIPFEQQSRIFARFFQGDCSSSRRFEGIGIGLSIAKSYVELLGGRLWLNSAPGGGSVFKFTLPYEKTIDS